MDPNILVLNNLDSLQRLDLPINLTIVLTKDLPNRNTPSTRESPLKVYSPGDTVTGYILVENTSENLIPFEMFLVSLEGTVTINDSTSKDFRTTDPANIFKKTFLNMYDIAACNHFGRIDYGQNTDRLGETCSETGAIYGLCDKKMLKPGKKYKKVFIFRLPSRLLDTACEHQSPEHLTLPSSFGVDCESCHGLSKEIEAEKGHGYGLVGDDGSHIRKNDLAGDGQSVSYSINVGMIGKRHESYKQFHTSSINDNYDFIFIKEMQHFFRFSTAGSQLNYDDDGSISASHFKSNFTSEDQIQQLDKLCEEMTEKLKLRRDLIMSGITDIGEQDAIIDAAMQKKNIYQSNPLEEENGNQKVTKSNIDFDNY
ncbi:unnamed protein product [Ambrosiozyma monospora]|uniref:Unnamed protein product n=1 Tax=Ambrosiozyma monospora TaxID=43982 RepID=A0ACB5TMB0_AMBMO|nr:unnamed protein product [Ambrosiozyma monospora]